MILKLSNRARSTMTQSTTNSPVILTAHPELTVLQTASPISPEYYQLGKIEVSDFIVDQKLDFCLGNVVKYVCRAGKKDPSKHLEDLKKAAWYLQREIKKVSDDSETE